MKVYISGKISGLPITQNKARFRAMQKLLEGLDFEVVNPFNNGLPADAPWESHIGKDVEMLLGCDAIYQFDDWRESVGASIEHDVAVRCGMVIMNERAGDDENLTMLKVQNAIYRVTGLKISDYATQSRQLSLVYARMFFAHYARSTGMTLQRIGKYIHRDHSTVMNLLRKYNDELRYNCEFRNNALEIADVLNKTTNLQFYTNTEQ